MKSIRTKLWLGMMIMAGIIILLLWLFQIVFLEKFYSSIELRQVAKKGNAIVKEIEKQNSFSHLNDSTKISDMMDSLIYKKQLSMQVTDTSGNVIYQKSLGNGINMPRVMTDAVRKVSMDALTGKKSEQKVTHPRFGYESMVIGFPIYYKDIVGGALIMALPMAPIKDTTDILKKQLVLITFLLLFVSVLISFFLAKNFTNPILSISKVAESYASGKYEEKAANFGEDEIGQLAIRMNAMGDALARQEILQRELIANVSHELRTPLTLIRGYAETLRDVTGENPEKREKQLGVIIEETVRLSKIVEDILNLSQLQAGAVCLELESFSLNEILQDIKNRYELQMEARTFQIHGVMELKENLLGDKHKIEQVFYNLLNNAFRHTKESDTVEVVVTDKDDRVKIEIKDSGDGIAKEDLEHIFERYYRGKRTDGKKAAGTGLGLAIVKNILEKHQVLYGVESETGKGTSFWFELNKEKSHTNSTNIISNYM